MAELFDLDPFDECFDKLTPRKIDTFSYREKPCRYEPPIGDHEGDIAVPCPFKADGYCGERPDQVSSLRILQHVLTTAYSERIKNVLSEPSTSVVIRSEQQFHLRDLDRFAQRRHFYEVVKNGTPGREDRFGVHCTRIHRKDRFGEYLGFVDLRQHYQRSALALGLLVVPSWIREDPNTFVICGDYGPLFGAHSFRSTVYSMQDPETIGAVCAQMCAIMALGMLSDRGVEVKGSFTLTYLAWKLGITNAPAASSARLGELEVTGLKPEQVRDVLRQCRVNSKRIRLDCARSGAEHLATRIIEANIYARFPVILAVDAGAWTGQPGRAPQGHAVTIVGARRSDAAHETIAFVVHDPGSGPFRHVRTRRCFAAAKEYCVRSDSESGDWKAGGNIEIVVAATKSIRRHVDDCIRWLRKFDFVHGDNGYSNSNASEEPFGPYENRVPNTDYRIRLLNRNTVGKFLDPYVPYEDSAARDKLRAYLAELYESRYWTIVGFRRDENGPNLKLSVVWLFDARELYDSLPVAKIWRSSDGTLLVWMRSE